jgi:hypothetical protein
MRKEPVTGARRVRKLSREQVEEALRTGSVLEDDDLVCWHNVRERRYTELSVRAYLRDRLDIPPR